MTELIWINGAISPLAGATIPVEERGFQFADGVYEVIRVYDGVTFTLAEHLDRLVQSAEGIRLALPMSLENLTEEIQSLIERSGLRDGMIYLQLTRGAAPRNHVIPKNPKPTLLFYVRQLPRPAHPAQTPGVKLITLEDERWKRCWIKTIALLPNVLAKTQAIEAGADEAVFVENGIITECSVSNLLAVINGKLITAPVGKKVLPGITRALLLDLAKSLNIRTEERPLTLTECQQADEIMITSTTREIGWVDQLDGKPIRRGGPGAIMLKLHEGYQARIRSVMSKRREIVNA